MRASQTGSKPIIDAVVAKGTMIYTDEYAIYARLPVWGYQHEGFKARVTAYIERSQSRREAPRSARTARVSI